MTWIPPRHEVYRYFAQDGVRSLYKTIWKKKKHAIFSFLEEKDRAIYCLAMGKKITQSDGWMNLELSHTMRYRFSAL